MLIVADGAPRTDQSDRALLARLGPAGAAACTARATSTPSCPSATANASSTRTGGRSTRRSADDKQKLQALVHELDNGGYTIFGEVVTGMEVVDDLVVMPTANDDPGGRGGTALDPVAMDRVTIQRP